MAEEEKTPDQTTETQETVEEKLFAGKYKSAEELERGYKEAEKMAHTKSQELAELKKKIQDLEEKNQKPADDANDDLADYEYMTKKDFVRELKRQQDELQKQFQKNLQEMQGYVQATMEIGKIRQKHPELSDKHIQAVINTYPEETDFEAALKQYKEDTAKAFGLYTTPPKADKPVPPIPGQLHGVEQFGVENEDRSRIDRLKKAGMAGKMPLTKK